MTQIEEAVHILRAGGLVAFPTETVYGLGADATSSAAVAKIFLAKGRPATNPLIIHGADVAMARHCAAEWPGSADRLAERFWPGPITLVVRRKRSGDWTVADAVAAGGDSVGIRVPDHPVALRLLTEFARPVAAPSANRSNHISPTTAAHVRADLGDRVDLILDGGPCRVGIESTVVDVTGEPTILRPGQIGAAAIESVLGRPVRMIAGTAATLLPARSPGQMEVHYAPRAPTFRFARADRPIVQQDQRRKLLVIDGDRAIRGKNLWSLPADPAKYAVELYHVLREMDATGEGEIWIEMPPDEPAWMAVRDRLLRATRPAF